MPKTPAPGGAPAHEVVAQKLRDSLLLGRWKAGTLLPTELELERLLKVSRITVRGGIAMLVAQRMIRVGQGFGTQVLDWLRNGSFELLGSLLQLNQGADRGVEQMRQVLWLRRVFYAALAELAAKPNVDLDTLKMRVAVLPIPFLAKTEIRMLDVLVEEELALCAVAEATDNVAAIFLAHALRRVLVTIADKSGNELKLADGSARFAEALDALEQHRPAQAAKLLTAACQVRERAYLELASHKREQ